MVGQISQWGHIRFIREYEKSCKFLELDKKHIMITLEGYNKIKKMFYEKWLLDLKKQGFESISEFKKVFLESV